jgi:hypothetical protein
MSTNAFENRHEEFLTLVRIQIQFLEQKRPHTTTKRYDDLINFLDILITEAEHIDQSQVQELSVWYSLALLTIQCIYEYETNPESFGIKALVVIELLANLPKIDTYTPTLVEPAVLADKMKTHRAEALAPYLDEDGTLLPDTDLTTLQSNLDEIIVFVENLDERASTLLASTVLTTIWKLLHVVEMYDVDLEEALLTSSHSNDVDSNTALIVGNMLGFLLSNQKSKA